MTYVAFEGIDGVGKSTQIERIAALYPDAGVTKEPGGTPLGRRIREILLQTDEHDARAEALLFLADRAEHTARVVRPFAGRLLLSDRSFVSGIAYAHVRDGLPIDTLMALNRFATDGRFPDAILFLTIDEAHWQARLRGRPRDTIESRGVAYMMRVQAAMRDVLQRFEIDHLELDAAQPPDTITKAIRNFLEERL